MAARDRRAHVAVLGDAAAVDGIGAEILEVPEAPGIETDFGTHAIVDITPELLKNIERRRKRFMQALEEDKGLEEMHFNDVCATFYDGIPPELRLPEERRQELRKLEVVQLPNSTPDLGEEVADTQTDFDWMIISKAGVSWGAALAHLGFVCFTPILTYRELFPEAT